MIRTLRLGCTPGGNCCSACRGGHLGDIPADSGSGDLGWLAIAAIIGGFFLAAGAAGKLRVR